MPLGPNGIVLKVRDTWPRMAKVYCHPALEWPTSPEVIERVPIRSCTRRGAAIDLIRNRGHRPLIEVVTLGGWDLGPYLGGRGRAHDLPMSESLDVLLIESHPGVGDPSAQVLVDAGHRVHRCHQSSDSGWVCVGLTDPTACPLEGHIDAAVLARTSGTTGRTEHEDGVRCAIRARVPIVQVRSGQVDGDTTGTYGQWVTLNSHERSLDAACRAAITLGHQPMVDEVLDKVMPLVRDAGLPADVTHCTVSSRWPTMTVSITIPGPADRRLEQAVSVRAYDALRTYSQDFTTVDVTVQVESELVDSLLPVR